MGSIIDEGGDDLVCLFLLHLEEPLKGVLNYLLATLLQREVSVVLQRTENEDHQFPLREVLNHFQDFESDFGFVRLRPEYSPKVSDTGVVHLFVKQGGFVEVVCVDSTFSRVLKLLE
jgi:hypothetical protein